MTYPQLVTILQNMHVTPPDIRRAALYLHHLQAAQVFFNTTLAVNLGANNYKFVRQAVKSANLLDELAATLDLYVGAAVDHELTINAAQGWTYAQYFNNVIFGVTYATNLANFQGRNTVSTQALTDLYGHFTGNIEQACRRVYTDRALLETFFRNLYDDDTDIVRIEYIKPTGSDFHKGGKQVLILTAGIVTLPQGNIFPDYSPRKFVYKPSDIEADCLLAGNSDAVNAAIPGFMTNSLFEIYNRELAIYKSTHPGFTGLPVKTYGFLPRNFQSAHGGGPPLPVRNAYGYIQYLDNDLQGIATHYFGYYPYASSDYMIFKGDNRQAIIRTFYLTMGALSALASSFSLHDLHLENVRVKNYMPNFIDMEISLNTATNSIQDTHLISHGIGGINGLFLDAQDAHWEVNSMTAVGAALYLNFKHDTVFYQNRLWEWHGTTDKSTIPINQPALVTGFTDGMTVLRAAQQNNAFNAWFLRMNNVVVRYIPYATAYFKNTFIADYYLNPLNFNGNSTMAQKLMNALTTESAIYVAPNNPNFLVLALNRCLVDLQHVDVPIFYYRIGMQEIVDSAGVQVPIPATVPINNMAIPYPHQPPVNFNVNVGRAAFFANVPTTTIINVNQVQVLGGAGYAARLNQLSTSVVNAFTIAGIDVLDVIPVN
jgi:hypothetical protein